MQISVFISRDSIFRRAGRRMEWEGTRSPLEHDAYGRVSLTEADRSLFLSLFDEAAMHAVDICRPFLQSVANSDEGLNLNITLSDDADTSGLQLTLENMMTAHVLALWQEIVSPTRAAASLSKRDDNAFKLLSILYHHKAPVRS